jgi:hypothetical protein
MNNLFFADDLVMFTLSIDLMQELLFICEKWAKENGLVFSISKCATICKEISPLFLSDQIIPQVDQFKYLGIYFDVNGINWSADIEGRIKKASQMVNFLNSRGMHVYGWRFSSSLLAIKCFVRSIFDYGLALAPPDTLITKMQVVIGEALRRMSSSRYNACREALSKMFYMELMSSRARELEAKFRFRLLNSRSDTPAGIIYREYSESHIDMSCLYHPDISLIHIITDSSKRSIIKQKLNEVREDDLHQIAIRKNPTGMASSIRVRWKKKPWFKTPGLSKEAVILISEWWSGKLTFHQKCTKCDGVVDRTHATECSGALEFLSRSFPQWVNEWHALSSRDSYQDKLINYI